MRYLLLLPISFRILSKHISTLHFIKQDAQQEIDDAQPIENIAPELPDDTEGSNDPIDQK